MQKRVDSQCQRAPFINEEQLHHSHLSCAIYLISTREKTKRHRVVLGRSSSH